MSRYIFKNSYSGLIARANLLAIWNRIFAGIALLMTMLFVILFFIFLVVVF